MWLLVILTFRYVQDTTGFPVYPNGTAQYYLLGDELFPAMLTDRKSTRLNSSHL